MLTCDKLTRTNSICIYAHAVLEVKGSSVRVREGSVVTGNSVGSMTSVQPLHVRDIYRLL